MQIPFRAPLIVSLICLAAGLTLAACQQEEAVGLEPGANAPGALDAAREACAAAGGTFERAPGSGNVELCVTRPADGNQPCATANDCEGFCLARSRTCAPVTPLLGCNDILLTNGTESTVCVN